MDKTKPTCGSIKVTSGTKGDNGWYTSNISLGVNDGSDATSGHSSTEIDTTKIKTDTTGKKVTLTTKDKAGNTCTTSETYKLDKTKPTCGTILIKSGTAGNNGWYKSDVSLKKKNGSDATSGHKSTTLSTKKVEGETSGTTVTLTTKDKAGNTCETSTTIKIDKNPPSYSGSCYRETGTDAEGTHYFLYRADYSDSYSGIDKRTITMTVNGKATFSNLTNNFYGTTSFSDYLYGHKTSQKVGYVISGLCDLAGNCAGGGGAILSGTCTY